MYEEMTPEAIRSAILEKLNQVVDTREGSYTDDLIRGISTVLSDYYQATNALVPIAFVDETSGIYIDKRAQEYGITRRPGTRAQVEITVTGDAGTTIPQGTVFSTQGGLRYISDAPSSIPTGSTSVIVSATAEDVGTLYNVPANTIIEIIPPAEGVEASNHEAAYGGTDIESDEDLLGRLYAYLQQPASSGNALHYRQWALEVPGVGDVRVVPVWDGPGTVKVVIVDSAGAPPSEAIIGACQEHIDAERPIGADVTVVGAESMDIIVEATGVEISSSTTLDDVDAIYRAALDAYVRGAVFGTYEIIYNRIAYMLLAIDGVVDFASLTVNGGTENIQVDDEGAPVLTTVTLQGVT